MKILKQPLWVQVAIASVVGIICGIIFQEKAIHFKIFGTIFVNLIKMVIVPLIIFSLISGICSIGSNSRASSIAIKSILAFLLSALFSVVLGILLAIIFQPGQGVKLPIVNSVIMSIPENHNLVNLIESFFSDNIIASMAEGNIIQIIIFTIIVGLTMAKAHTQCANVINICNEMSIVIFKVIEQVVKLAPIGVFGYLSWSVGTQGLDILLSLMKLVGIIILGCVAQYILYGAYLLFFSKLNPIIFFKKMLEPQILAFSTSSSKASLTTTMRVMHDQLGVSKNSVNFVLPIGTSINMNGGAIYLTVASLFFAQSLNINLNLTDYIILGFTCTIGSIGAAGIPSGILLFLGMALTSINLPAEFVVLVAGIDRILDMFTTMVNVMGDAVITTIIDKSEKNLDIQKYYS